MSPRIENETLSQNGWSASLSFPSEERYFQGHFPGFSVLPGVIQLGVAVKIAAERLGKSSSPRQVKKMKFTRVIVPEETVTLALVVKGENEIAYEYRKGEYSCSSGILCY